MKKQIWIMTVLLAGAALPAYAEHSMAGMDMGGMEMHEKSAQATHQGKGKVVSVDKAKSTVKLAHEAIKSLNWPGMTMDFKVADAKLLDGLKAGDVVTFELGKGASGDWQITGIKPQGGKAPH